MQESLVQRSKFQRHRANLGRPTSFYRAPKVAVAILLVGGGGAGVGLSGVRGETDSHPILDLLDLSLLPIADQLGNSTKNGQSMRQKANAPSQKRPLNPPPIRAQHQVCDKQHGHHKNKDGKVNVKSGDLGHLPLRESQLFLLVHGATVFGLRAYA